MDIKSTDSDPRRGLARDGEAIAAELLSRKGYQILAKNWRTRFGEMDIVAAHGTSLVFVEVKCRTDGSYARPEIAVSADKRRRLRRLAEAFIAWEAPTFRDARFDVVTVVMSPVLEVRHIEDAF